MQKTAKHKVFLVSPGTSEAWKSIQPALGKLFDEQDVDLVRVDSQTILDNYLQTFNNKKNEILGVSVSEIMPQTATGHAFPHVVINAVTELKRKLSDVPIFFHDNGFYQNKKIDGRELPNDIPAAMNLIGVTDYLRCEDNQIGENLVKAYQNHLKEKPVSQSDVPCKVNAVGSQIN